MVSPTDMLSTRRDYLHRFHTALPDAKRFRVRSDDAFSQRIVGPRLSFEFSWERYPEDEDVPVILLYSSWRPSLTMHLWLLRLMFGSTPGPSSAEFMARVITDEFADFLAGDFKRRKIYQKLEDRVLDKIPEVYDLTEGHPTRIKFQNFDPTWLDDM